MGSLKALQTKLMIALLALFSLLSIGCSTPPVYNTPSEEGTAWWAYQQCLSAQSASGNTKSCNSIGVSTGKSYTDWTFGSNLYVNDYQPTDSVFSNKFYRAVRVQAYRDYLQALPDETQSELKAKWLELAQGA